MIKNHVFITGTDTHVGKTWITGLIAKYLSNQQKSVITQKWIQTGSNTIDDIHEHLTIQKKSINDITPFIKECCPYIFTLPASPHLAAHNENKSINITHIKNSFYTLSSQFDHVIVEGSGGLLVPVTQNKTLTDITKELALPTLLVIDNKLGCINHSLLSINTLKQHNIPLLGIIMTETTPTTNKTEKIIRHDNIKIIQSLGKTPLLASIPFLDKTQKRNYSLRIKQ